MRAYQCLTNNHLVSHCSHPACARAAQLEDRVAELEQGYRDIEAKDRSSVDQIMFAKTVGEVYRRVMPEFSLRPRDSVGIAPVIDTDRTRTPEQLRVCNALRERDGLPPLVPASRAVSTDQKVDSERKLYTSGIEAQPAFDARVETIMQRGAERVADALRASNASLAPRQLCDGCNAPMPGPHLAGEPACRVTTTTEQRPKSPEELATAFLRGDGPFGGQGSSDAECGTSDALSPCSRGTRGCPRKHDDEQRTNDAPLGTCAYCSAAKAGHATLERGCTCPAGTSKDTALMLAKKFCEAHGDCHARSAKVHDDLASLILKIRAEQRSDKALPADLASARDPESNVFRGIAGRITIGDMAGDGTGPWRLFLGEYGVATWPSKAADEDPRGYAASVARTVQNALADRKHGPVVEQRVDYPTPALRLAVEMVIDDLTEVGNGIELTDSWAADTREALLKARDLDTPRTAKAEGK